MSIDDLTEEERKIVMLFRLASPEVQQAALALANGTYNGGVQVGHPQKSKEELWDS